MPILTISQPHAALVADALLKVPTWPRTAKVQLPFIVESLRLGGYFSRQLSSTWTKHDLSKRYILKAREVREEVDRNGKWVNANWSANDTIGRFFEKIVGELVEALKGHPLEPQLRQRSAKAFASVQKKRLSAAAARELASLSNALRTRTTEHRSSLLDWTRLRSFAQVSEAGRIMLESVIWAYDVPAQAFFWNGQEFVTWRNETLAPPPRMGVRPFNPLEVGPEVRRALIDLTGAYKFVGIVPQLDVSTGLDFAPSLMYRLTVDVIRDARERLKAKGWTDWQVDVIDQQFRLAGAASLGAAIREHFTGVARDLNAIGIELLDVWVACGGHIMFGASGFVVTLGTGIPPPDARELNVAGRIYPVYSMRPLTDDLKRFILLRGP